MQVRIRDLPERGYAAPERSHYNIWCWQSKKWANSRPRQVKPRTQPKDNEAVSSANSALIYICVVTALDNIQNMHFQYVYDRDPNNIGKLTHTHTHTRMYNNSETNEWKAYNRIPSFSKLTDMGTWGSPPTIGSIKENKRREENRHRHKPNAVTPSRAWESITSSYRFVCLQLQLTIADSGLNNHSTSATIWHC